MTTEMTTDASPELTSTHFPALAGCEAATAAEH